MGFNARWELEDLAELLGKPVPTLLAEFKHDLTELTACCPVFQLGVTSSGNQFTLTDASSRAHEPRAVAGLYAIFSPEAVIYFGEASDLWRRQIKDPDNTADSGKVFNNQGRAILKLLLHRGWAAQVGLKHLFMQIYPANAVIPYRAPLTLEDCYRVGQFRKSLEGAMGFFIQQCLPGMLKRAMEDNVLRHNG